MYWQLSSGLFVVVAVVFIVIIRTDKEIPLLIPVGIIMSLVSLIGLAAAILATLSSPILVKIPGLLLIVGFALSLALFGLTAIVNCREAGQARRVRR